MKKNYLLNLSDNAFTNDDVSVILSALAKDPAINQLDLSNNYIGDSGIQTIVDSPFMNKVFYFNLYNNLIGDEGAVAVVSSSKQNNVASLNLSKNCISANGIKALSKHLPGSKIVNLSLIFNPGSVDPTAVDTLLEKAKQHRLLQYLHVPTEFNNKVRPILLENRNYVSITKKELIMVLNLLREHDDFAYQISILEPEFLSKFQVFYCNQMLNSAIVSFDNLICIKLQNYINDNFFKITQVVSGRLQIDDSTSSAITDIPQEVLSKIASYCMITDVKPNARD